MAKKITEQLLELCALFGRHRNISHWRVSFLARGDGQFFKRLEAGKGCTVMTATAVAQWFSDNWPDDLAWPDDIPRPTTSKKDAA